MPNQIFNWIKNNPKIIATAIIILLILAFVLARPEKFPPPEPNPDEPNQPEENFSPPVVAEPAKRQTLPRNAQGRFIKKSRAG